MLLLRPKTVTKIKKQIRVPDKIGLFETANLPAKLKLCVGARVMLIDNISVSDRLINGSIWTVQHLDGKSNLLFITMHLTFDDPKAGNSLKGRKCCGELNECVPITARVKRFSLKKVKITVIANKKCFPLILGNAITMHKSQGTTLFYMQGDLVWSASKKTIMGKNCQETISASVLHFTFLCQKS